MIAIRLCRYIFAVNFALKLSSLGATAFITSNFKTCRSVFAVAQWFDSKATLNIPVAPSRVFDSFSKLNEHPKWSPWLDKVDYDSSSGISVWTLKTLGLVYKWRANNTIIESPHIIQWESIDGFPNRGKVTFTSSDNTNTNTLVDLTVSFDLPSAGVYVVEQFGTVRKFVDATLLSDLRRFKMRLLREIREERLQRMKDPL
mmetsp:Transcript_34535/g.35201  ORF Transcript_34535/g.35201 Transcript_34535/m.35201 type:complete len:201 (+) Transcript_34535:107-709(+)